MTDWLLIRRFADHSDQAAFAELLRRHTDLVYATCRRELGDPGLAEDAAQAVFLILARKATALRPQTRGATLAGWLFQTALFTSKNLRRQERRRQTHEHEAALMHHDELRYTAAEGATGWADAEPLLHDALQALPGTQLSLILERFFQERPLAEIGAGHGISEDAARMRVNRALERLRRFFAAHGVTLSAATLATLLPLAVPPAPAHCAETLRRLNPTPGPVTASTHAHIIAQGAIQTMNTQRLIRQLTAAALLVVSLGAALSLRTALAVRSPTPGEITRPVTAGQDAKTVLDRMYATYAAMRSFRCRITTREDPLGTAQDADYEIERPNKIRFRRVTLIGPELSGQATAISDGHTLFVTCTENHGAADRYAKTPLGTGTDYASLFASFGGLPAWGTQPDAGMPDAALGRRLHDTTPSQLSAPEYSLGQPLVLDLPGVARPVALEVVIARMHHLDPVGAVKDDPEVVTYYIGRDDHLLYKLTAAYMVGPAQWDTRTETCNDIERDPKLPLSDFIFTPPPGSREVSDTDELFPGGEK